MLGKQQSLSDQEGFSSPASGHAWLVLLPAYLFIVLVVLLVIGLFLVIGCSSVYEWWSTPARTFVIPRPAISGWLAKLVIGFVGGVMATSIYFFSIVIPVSLVLSMTMSMFLRFTKGVGLSGRLGHAAARAGQLDFSTYRSYLKWHRDSSEGDLMGIYAAMAYIPPMGIWLFCLIFALVEMFPGRAYISFPIYSGYSAANLVPVLFFTSLAVGLPLLAINSILFVYLHFVIFVKYTLTILLFGGSSNAIRSYTSDETFPHIRNFILGLFVAGSALVQIAVLSAGIVFLVDGLQRKQRENKTALPKVIGVVSRSIPAGGALALRADRVPSTVRDCGNRNRQSSNAKELSERTKFVKTSAQTFPSPPPSSSATPGMGSDT